MIAYSNKTEVRPGELYPIVGACDGNYVRIEKVTEKCVFIKYLWAGIGPSKVYRLYHGQVNDRFNPDTMKWYEPGISTGKTFKLHPL